ncbi:MAG: alpha hydrolase [Candidatus Methanoliparum thermophilum]|uniref:Alpha hydrolase n=1 Tax=Methanoliparum thermophilum TaxID=2491083 RepID=A0A520KUP4_METT2|nr:hypothetical protein [Candidatus Methanoliparum sp. LAM-1]RZN65421.1 MAG: alpha hydrolase [Candidatus Methanoliparum thermophilum]BDC35490.1 alpha hydrolase [Candidatus Methanoliparum sp. LAM-1]
MIAAVLFSGGQDSSLASLILSNYFDVELLTFSTGLSQNWETAKNVAAKIGLPYKTVFFEDVVDEAARIMINDGFPNNGLNYIHKKALEYAASMDRYDILADGTRRDDRAPLLNYNEIKSLEDRYSISYVRPLAGFGRKIIDALVNRFFIIREEEDMSCRSDYEYEIRMFISDRYGKDTVDKIFPKKHLHSLVVDKKKKE